MYKKIWLATSTGPAGRPDPATLDREGGMRCGRLNRRLIWRALPFTRHEGPWLCHAPHTWLVKIIWI